MRRWSKDEDDGDGGFGVLGCDGSVVNDDDEGGNCYDGFGVSVVDCWWPHGGGAHRSKGVDVEQQIKTLGRQEYSSSKAARVEVVLPRLNGFYQK